MAEYIALALLVAAVIMVAAAPGAEPALLVPEPRPRPRFKTRRRARDDQDLKAATGWLARVHDDAVPVMRQGHAVPGVPADYLSGTNQPPWPAEPAPETVHPSMLRVAPGETVRFLAEPPHAPWSERHQVPPAPRVYEPGTEDPPTIVGRLRRELDGDLGDWLDHLPSYREE
jgi:hypothetical protein